MSLQDKLLELQQNRSVVIEASQLLGSGRGEGGRTEFTDAFSTARQMNPLRFFASQRDTDGKSAAQFVAKVGNAATGVVNPWGYGVQVDSGSPNIDTVFWQLPTQAVTAQLPIRQAAFDDINGLEDILRFDLASELYTLEGLSMVRNNDQGTIGAALTATGSGTVTTYGWSLSIPNTSTFTVGQVAFVAGNGNTTLNGYVTISNIVTNVSVAFTYPQATSGAYTTGAVTIAPVTNTAVSTGGLSGLRGLDSYLSASTAAYGSSGSLSTNGIHTIATNTIASLGAIAYNDVVDLVNALPPQYWMMEGTCFQAHPTTIQTLRKIKDTAGLPVFLEIGDYDAAAVGMMFGFPVIPNANLSTGAGAFPLYLGNWKAAMEVVDVGQVEITAYEQSVPGSITLFAQKRVASSVKDPFALVRIRTTA